MLNGDKFETGDSVSLIEVLRMKSIELDKVVIEYNHKVLEKKDWEKTLIQENDNIEILRFVGGG